MQRSILFLLFLTACSKELKEPHPPKPVKVQQVSQAQSRLEKPFFGVTRAEDRVNLSFRVSGPLIEKEVYVGDRVQAGDILYRIDPREYELDVEEKKAELEKAKAAFAFGQTDYERARRVQEKDAGAISESLVDQKREEKNRLQAQVKVLEAQVEKAEDQLAYTYLVAPFEGIVVATYVDNFEMVRKKEEILRLLNTERVEMVIDVPEQAIALIPSIESFTVRLSVLPDRTFHASVKEIGQEASKTTRTYPVTLVMEQPDDLTLFSGMSGEARVNRQKKPTETPSIWVLPLTAVVTDSHLNQSFVFVVDPTTNLVEKRNVQTGEVSSDGITILSGVQEGELVVTGGANYLIDGQTVEILSP